MNLSQSTYIINMQSINNKPRPRQCSQEKKTIVTTIGGDPDDDER